MISFAHLQLKAVNTDSQTQRNIDKLKELYLLSTMSTEQLLGLRDQFYSVYPEHSTQWTKDSYEIEGYSLYRNVWISQSLLYRELSKRPHVPNKQEAKQIRVANARGK